MTNHEPRRALILYASQTGTSEDLSLELSDTLTRLRFAVTVHSFASFTDSFTSLPSHTLIFLLVSTTGQGAIPDSAIPLWRKLCRKKIAATWLQDVEFGMFALGDTTYPKFCWAGRMVSRRLLQLGAREAMQRVEGNQSSEEGTDGAFVRWVETVKKTVRERWPLPDGVEEIPGDTMLPPKWVLEIEGDGDISDGMNNLQLAEGRAGALLSTVTQNDRVTAPDHWQDVRLLEFELPEDAKWDPGDTVSVSPQNFPEDVDLFIELQHWEHIADRPLSIKPSPESTTSELPPYPITPTTTPLTLRTLLTHHLHINTIPTRRFFSLAAHLTTDTQHKDRLADFADPQWVEELWDYTTRPRRKLLEVLQEFSTVQIPVSRLLDLIPRLRDRYFSIANSHSGPARSLQLLVAIVKYRTILKKPRFGVCSRWIAAMKPGDRIDLVISRGSLALSAESVKKPVVMIAPGTGVAPMRALMQHRARAGATDSLLFFGCRNRDKDFFFAEEWAGIAGLKVFPAFSRDQKQKVYVQALVRVHAREVWEAVGEKGGNIIVCGSSGRMPQAVREALIEIFEECGGWERERAKGFLGELERGGRYLQETWG